MKTKYTNSEIFHTWMYDQSTDIQNQHGTIFSRGNTIYSYGTHFILAQFVTNKKGERCLMLNDNGHSNTTKKQQSYLNKAIPFDLQTFTTPEASLNHMQNIHFYMDEIKHYLVKAKNARLHSDFYLEQAEVKRHECYKYVNFFSLNNRLKKEQKQIVNNSLSSEDIEIIITAQKKEEKRRKAAKKRVKKEAYKRELQKIEDWKKGKLSYIYTSEDVYLRLSKGLEFIQTSQGANVGIQNAKLLYNRIKQNESIKGTSLDGYKVKGIENNHLIVGCHIIPLKEVERLAIELKW